jgi:hypothetical protein
MILMALDHVRDFMGAPGISPTNLAQATVSLFFTRWITNICAPVVVCYARYGQAHWMFESSSLDQYPITTPPGWGFGLPMIYLLWAFVVIALYPLCAWFARLKQRSGSVWLSYL